MPTEAQSPDDTTLHVRCPVCGSPAEATVAWRDAGGAPHADVRGYHCPHHCQVDAETIRNLVGAQ